MPETDLRKRSNTMYTAQAKLVSHASTSKSAVGSPSPSRKPILLELENEGLKYCQYQFYSIKELQFLMYDNLNDIRDILSEYFKLKNYNTRKTE